MKRLLPLILGLLLLSVTVFAKESKPELTDIIITTSESNLLLFATVQNGFIQEMIDALHSGLPLRFTYAIRLHQIRGLWLDKELADLSITRVLSYDSLKEKYRIQHEDNNQVVTTSSLTEAKQLMTELNGVEIIALSQLIPDAPYTLELKATLEENTLPLGMHYVLPFTSLWNIETDWRTIEFRY
ncbi:MAG: hypothetical protein CSA34_02100 [Desulfobulbus propionicus]|nr:MAG: hypothetical protein CSA34_02100 [Desulfobulbus propionicus]